MLGVWNDYGRKQTGYYESFSSHIRIFTTCVAYDIPFLRYQFLPNSGPQFVLICTTFLFVICNMIQNIDKFRTCSKSVSCSEFDLTLLVS